MKKYSINTGDILLKIQGIIGFEQYYIYKIQIEETVYIGSTNNFDRRIREHKKDLKEERHINTSLQQAFNLTPNKFSVTICLSLFTHSKSKVYDVEQRYINKYSNSNEATASKDYTYNLEELETDLIDMFLKFLFL